MTRKAAFIAQVMRGRLDVREIEDIGDSALSYNEVKALAAGNPLLLDHAQAQADLTRLECLERNHFRGLDSLRYTIRSDNTSIEHLQQRLAATDVALDRRVDTRADAFAMNVDGYDHRARAEANQALRAVLQPMLGDSRLPSGTTRTIGVLGGFTATATLHRDANRHATIALQLLDVPLGEPTLKPVEVATGDLVIKLENRLHDLETIRAHTVTDISRREAELAHAQEQLDQPFRHTDALTEARERLPTSTRSCRPRPQPRQPPQRQPTSSHHPDRSRPHPTRPGRPRICHRRTPATGASSKSQSTRSSTSAPGSRAGRRRGRNRRPTATGIGSTPRRHNNARSRNARLAALRSLFHYAALRHPEHARLIQQVLAIPQKRFDRKPMAFLNTAEVDALLAAPDLSRWEGRRDRALMTLATQAGLRLYELIGLNCGDVELNTGAHVRCTGKGRKQRCTPLTTSTASVLRVWLQERDHVPTDPLFSTRTGRRLSDDAVERRIALHHAHATQSCPSLAFKNVTPHVLRHYVDGRVMWPVEMTALAGTPRWPVPAT